MFAIRVKMKHNKINLKELDNQMRLSAEEIEKINGGIADSAKASCTCCCRDYFGELGFFRASRPGKKVEAEQLR